MPIKGVLFRLTDSVEGRNVVKVTREEIECDVCAEIGTRYTVNYPDGIKVLDRCDKHAKDILKLKDAPGTWSPMKGGSTRGRLQVLTPQEISAKRRK